MSGTSYAAYTRVKAKYGKRLTEKDYKALLDCEKVSDVMAYLKSNTHYINAFGEANERGIRRGLFESLLRQYQINEFDTICRFELSLGEDISHYIAHKTEIDEIIRILTKLNSRDEQVYHLTVPAHIAKKTSINLNALAKAENYEQFLEAARKTPYEPILKQFSVKNNERIPITEIENRLYTKLCKELFEAISKLDETEKEELKELLQISIDCRNFLNIIRLKNYYVADDKIIAKYILPYGSIKDKVIFDMCAADDVESVYNIMAKTRTGKMLKKLDSEQIDELELLVRFKKARHNIYFSDSPATVMMSYIFLCEIELHNLICIIEGARYNVDKEVIKPLLIY